MVVVITVMWLVTASYRIVSEITRWSASCMYVSVCIPASDSETMERLAAVLAPATE